MQLTSKRPKDREVEDEMIVLRQNQGDHRGPPPNQQNRTVNHARMINPRGEERILDWTHEPVRSSCRLGVSPNLVKGSRCSLPPHFAFAITKPPCLARPPVSEGV
jgi:hypothetical protein